MNRLAEKGWTITEMLIVVAVIVLIVTISLPALERAREQARRAACASNMHHIHQGVMNYASANSWKLPPFALDQLQNASLPMAGHWGGREQANDPTQKFRKNVDAVNFYALVFQGMVSRTALLCPGSRAGFNKDAPGYFPYTRKFSSYSLRFPYTSDLFQSGESFGYFRQASSGFRVTPNIPPLPFARIDGRYRIGPFPGGAVGDGIFDVVEDTLFADTFWYQDSQQEGDDSTDPVRYAVSMGWCHEDRFNVMSGGGSLKLVQDDGTVAGHTHSPERAIAWDEQFNARPLEVVWQFFDRAK